MTRGVRNAPQAHGELNVKGAKGQSGTWTKKKRGRKLLRAKRQP